MDEEDAANDVNELWKKSKQDSRWDKHHRPREVAKEQQVGIITSSQQYGWREPYDNLIGDNNRSGIC